MTGDPTALLERTVNALSAMDTAKLEQLRAAAESTPPADALLVRSARRTAELQRSLQDLLRSTEASMRVLRRLRTREEMRESPWAH